MVGQLIQNLVWILLSGESMDPLKPFEWIWMVVQLPTNTVQMVSPCVYKTNGHLWKWKFWMVSNGLSVERLMTRKIGVIFQDGDPFYTFKGQFIASTQLTKTWEKEKARCKDIHAYIHAYMYKLTLLTMEISFNRLNPRNINWDNTFMMKEEKSSAPWNNVFFNELLFVQVLWISVCRHVRVDFCSDQQIKKVLLS